MVCIENSHLLRVKSKLYLVIRNHTTILAGVPLWLLSYARVDIYVIILISKCEKTKWAIIKDGKAGSFRPAAVLSKKKKKKKCSAFILSRRSNGYLDTHLKQQQRRILSPISAPIANNEKIKKQKGPEIPLRRWRPPPMPTTPRLYPIARSLRSEIREPTSGPSPPPPPRRWPGASASQPRGTGATSATSPPPGSAQPPPS